MSIKTELETEWTKLHAELGIIGRNLEAWAKRKEETLLKILHIESKSVTPTPNPTPAPSPVAPEVPPTTGA